MPSANMTRARNGFSVREISVRHDRPFRSIQVKRDRAKWLHDSAINTYYKAATLGAFGSTLCTYKDKNIYSKNIYLLSCIESFVCIEIFFFFLHFFLPLPISWPYTRITRAANALLPLITHITCYNVNS